MIKDIFRWIAWKFGARYVVLYDYDGDQNIRRVFYRDGKVYANRHGYNIRTVEIRDNGELGNGAYVEKWAEYIPFSKSINLPKGFEERN